MIASANPLDTARATAGGDADDARIRSLGVALPTPRGRWFVALKWGRDRRRAGPDAARPARPRGGPPSFLHHPLSRAWLVAFATSFAIAAACFAVLAYALILE
jgi:hypothetical protein